MSINRLKLVFIMYMYFLMPLVFYGMQCIIRLMTETPFYRPFPLHDSSNFVALMRICIIDGMKDLSYNKRV
jgi:hypothetical protein